MNRIPKEKRIPRANPGRVAAATGMSLLLFLGQTAPILANPTGGIVVAGSATIGAAGPTLTINQSTGSAIINWQQFSIANGETTKFIVPNAFSATLNRVTGGNPSQIYGTLQSNGVLLLVNPSGIVVGPNGRIDTASFMASTLNVSNQQFLAGDNLEFAGNSGAPIDNQGVIHASTGDVYLIANQVNNKGSIDAPQGTVGLAAGSDILFQQAGNQHLFVQPTAAGTKRATGVTNSGTINAAAAELKAAGGNAYALAINNTGSIAATGYKKVNGQVYLISDGGNITNSGKISARTASGNGGTISVDGTGTTNASGKVVNSGTLDASSATVVGGKGGSVTLSSKGGSTVHSGAILAKGGQGGAGGNVDVSGVELTFSGTVDTSSRGGTTGTLLLDPATFIVAPTGGDETGAAVATSLAANNVVLNADTLVEIIDNITWTSGNTLTLSTNTVGSSAIVISGAISGIHGGLILAGANDSTPVSSTGSVNVASFILQHGIWTQSNPNGTGLPAFTASSDFEIQNSSEFLRFSGGNGSPNTPFQITDIYGLEGIGSSAGLLALDWELMNNIDGAGAASWSGGQGFAPIGNGASRFAGTLDGMGHTIDGLQFNNSASGDELALFGAIGATGTVENLGVTNVQITGATNLGAVVGQNFGTIDSVFSTGTIVGSNSSDAIGGIAGANVTGTISNSYSTVNVSGSDNVGGLVGFNTATISTSYASGTVTGPNGGSGYGGLVGFNSTDGVITDSYSTSALTFPTSGVTVADVGGLVGFNGATASITRSYSSGTVTGPSGTGSIGAFAGESPGTISSSFWDTTTSGQSVGVGTDNGNNITPGLTGATMSTLMNSVGYSVAGWDIGNSNLGHTWLIFEGQTRPMLGMEYSMTINTAHQLQLIGFNSTTLSASYTLGTNVDVSGTTNPSDIWGTSTTNGGVGFLTIGMGGNFPTFSGTLNGQGHTIDGLYINAPSGTLVAPFGVLAPSGVLENVGMTNVSISGGVNGGGEIGGLLAENDGGLIDHVFVAGTVNGNDSSGGTGGIVGDMEAGTLSNSYNAASVSIGRSDDVGGLIGFMDDGTVSTSYNSGTITGDNDVGGLVGDLESGSLSDVYNIGSVNSTFTGSTFIGGLAGFFDGTITNAYNSGVVTGATRSTDVGAIVGNNVTDDSSAISGTFWDTDTSGTSLGVGSDSSNSTAGVIGETMDELVFTNAFSAPTYSGEGWNIGADPTTNTWVIIQGQTRPMLAMEYGTTIRNAHQLQLIDLNSTTMGATYTLANNIDASGTTNASDVWGTSANGGPGFIPLGYIDGSTGSFFEGVLNGAGHTVTGLTIDLPDADFAGLISSIDTNAVVENIGLINVNVTGDRINGGLAGSNEGTISNSYVTGLVTSITDQAGGLVGDNYGTINSSYSTANVNGPSTVGGLVGFAYTGSQLNNVYSSGMVAGNGTGVGGLVGWAAAGTINNAYSSATVTDGVNSSSEGAFVGQNGGGSVGTSTISNSFYNSDTANGLQGVGVNQGTITNLTVATTTQLQTQTFILSNAPSTPTWDFTSVWTTNGGTTLPQLTGRLGPAVSVPAAAPSTDTLSGIAYSDSGGTTAASGATIDLIFDGSILGSTTTNGSGQFSFSVDPTDLTGGILLTDALNGNLYYQSNNPGSVSGLNLLGSTLTVLADAATNSALLQVAGGLTDANINYTSSTANLVTHSGINMAILSNYSLGSGITASGTLTTAPTAVLTSTSDTTITANAMNLGGIITTPGTLTVTSSGSISAGASVSAGGFILTGGSWNQVDGQNGLSALPAFTDTGDFELQNSSTFSRFAGGTGTTNSPYQITDVFGLQGLGSPSGTLLTSSAVLNNNIDATGTASWNFNTGFTPIGHYDFSDSSDANTYSGTFNGQNHTINGLTVNRSSSQSGTGLFGDTASAGTIENLSLTNVSITGNEYVGGLAGVGNSTTSNVSVSGSINGGTYVGGVYGISSGAISDSSAAVTLTGTGLAQYMGGLVGFVQFGSIMNSSTSGTVNGLFNLGGLVGDNAGTITGSHSTANIVGGAASSDLGGLVGVNGINAPIGTSYAAGSVTASGGGVTAVGGLVGFNEGSLNKTFSSGTVNAGANATDVGGLVGDDELSITNSYSTSPVTGGTAVGGLVGFSNGGNIGTSYSIGAVTGSSNAGGLVGSSDNGSVADSYFSTDGSGKTIGIANPSGTAITYNGVTATAVTGQTTVQLEQASNFDSAFDFTNIWTTNNGATTPQLIGVTPGAVAGSGNGMGTFSGVAFTDSGSTPSPDTTINLIFDGTLLGSTTTDNLGNYSFNITISDLTTGLLVTDPADHGNTLYQLSSPSGASFGADIWGNTLIVNANSIGNAGLKAAAGALTGVGINYLVNGSALATNSGINIVIQHGYTLDGAITASGTFTTGSAANLTGSQNVTLTGSSVSMEGTFNTTGSITVVSTDGPIDLEEIGTDAGTAFAHGLALNSAGAVTVNDSSIQLSGGDFTAMGTGSSGTLDGVDIINSNIDTEGGSYTLTGAAGSFDGEGTQAGIGVLINNSSLITAHSGGPTTGNYTINGTSDLDDSFENDLDGVEITHSVVSVVNGAMSITGTVSSSTTSTTSNGISIDDASVVSATGIGSISLMGNTSGTTSSTGNYGVHVLGGSIISATDASGSNVSGININGTAGDMDEEDTIATDTGVTVEGGSSLIATGSAQITLVGFGGTDTNTDSNNNTASGGVFVTSQTDGEATSISSNSGAISITGTSGASPRFSFGLNVFGYNGGTAAISSNSGSIAINGSTTTQTNSSSSLDGVIFQEASQISSVNGNIAITGNVLNGTASFDSGGSAEGVNVFDGSIVTTGTGSISLTGDTTGTTANETLGGVLATSETISTGGGNITINGTGPGASELSDELFGTKLTNGTVLNTNSGTISVTGKVGNGSAGNGVLAIDAIDGTGITSGGAVSFISLGGDVDLSGLSGGLTAPSTSITTPIESSTTAVFGAPAGTVTLTGGDFDISEFGGAVTYGPINVANLSIEQDNGEGQSIGATNLSAITTGSLTVNTVGAVNINGAIQATGPVLIQNTAGNIVFGSAGSITDSGTGNSVTLAAGIDLASSHYIINNSTIGANAIQVSNGANFYLFSADPTYDQFNGITVTSDNTVFNATYPATESAAANQELFFVATADDVGPNNPNAAPPTGSPTLPSTSTGGADDSGSNIVPPVLTPNQPPITYVSGTPEISGSVFQPSLLNFVGNGASAYLGQQDGGLANSSGNSGQVGQDDNIQMSGGQVNNVANPQAQGVLNLALGPIVYHSLADALKAIGDWADVSNVAPGGDSTASSGGTGAGQETILSAGDTVVMGDSGVKKVAAGDVPRQLRDALSGDVLRGMNAGASH